MKKAKKRLLMVLASVAMLTVGALGGCSCKDDKGSSTPTTKHEHTWGEWTQTTPPTCTEAGEETRVCSGCEETEVRTVEGGHSVTYHQAVEAGCDTFGNVEYWFCSVCLKKFSDEECTTEIDDVRTNMKGHTWKGDVCVVCGEKKSSEGLAFVKIENKDEYAVAGIGGCKDAVVKIPSSYDGYPVTEIADGAFTDYKGIVSVNIPSSIRSIGHLAFHGCVRLIEVCNESALTVQAGRAENGWVGYYAKNVYASDTGESKLSTDGDGFTVYTDGETRTLVDYVGEDLNVEIPEDVSEIGAYALYAKEILSLRIPTTVQTIGFYGVAGCSRLTSVVFDEDANLSELGRYAFYQCQSLQEIRLPNSVKRIGDDAFYGCYRLSAVSLPQSLEEIGGSAFYNCYHLTRIDIPSSVRSIDTYAFFNCYTLAEVRNASPAITLTQGGVDNGYVAYYAKNVYTGEVGSKLQTQDGFVLYVDGTEKLALGYVGEETVLTLPDGITAVNERAFYGLGNVTEIVVPTSVQTIGEAAFEACESLNKLTIPFVGASATETVDTHFGYVFGAADGYHNQDKVPQSLKEVIVLGGERIGESAFRDCKYLTKLTIDASVRKVFNGAFYGCERLETCLFADGSALEAIDYDAFRNCVSLKAISIPTGVKTIGAHVFHGCLSLQVVEFGESSILKEIGNNAFYECAALRSIELPDSVKTIENFVFYGCVSLEDVQLGAYVSTIGDGAFGECSSLTALTLPSSLSKLGHGAFGGCTALSTLQFSATKSAWEGVEKVGNWKEGVPATQIVCEDGSVAL